MAVIVFAGNAEKSGISGQVFASGILGGPEQSFDSADIGNLKGYARQNAIVRQIEGKESIMSAKDTGVLSASAMGAHEQRWASDSYVRYAASSVDTLGTLAEKFSLQSSTLVSANPSLARGKIKAGQTLLIPPGDGKMHIVQSGESLKSIALRYGASQSELQNANPLTGALSQGLRILVPAAIDTDKNEAVIFFSPAVGNNLGVLHAHNAVDIAAPCRTAVTAAAPGIVVDDEKYADGNDEWNGGYGRFVLIEHSGGVRTRYAHLRDVDVSVGDSVKRGEKIGAIGDTGIASSCHLHFEVYGAANPFATK